MSDVKKKAPVKRGKTKLDVVAKTPGPLEVIKPQGFALPPFAQPPPSKNTTFSMQQITAIRGSLQGMTQAQIGVQMGVNPSTVAGHIRAAKKKLDQNSVLRQALDKKGVTLDKVADVLLECMGAETTIITKHGAATNKDHRVRLEAAKYVTILQGAEPAKKIEIEQTTFEQRLVLIARMEEAEGAACGD